MTDRDHDLERLTAENELLRQRIASLEVECRPCQADRDEAYRSFVDEFRGIAFRGKLGFRPVLIAGEVEAITGHTAEEFLAGQIRIDQLVHPDDLPGFLERNAPHLTTAGYAVDQEYRIVREDGRIVWLREISHNVCDCSGKPAFVQGLAHDITKRKQAEQALHESRERYRALAESSADVIYILDEHGTLLYGNRVAAAYMRVAPEELVGKTQQDLFPPETAQRHLKRIRRVFETGEMGEIDEHYCIKGQNVWLNVRLIPILDEQGRVSTAMGVCRDITAWKQAEEDLRRSRDELEERVRQRTAELDAANQTLDIFRLFAENARQGFGMADMEGHITYWNPALCRMFGETHPEKAIGKPVASYYPPEYLEKRQNEVVPAMLRDGHWEGELMLFPVDGQARPVVQHAFLVRDERGVPVRLAAVITDVSEQKRAAEALQRERQTLRHLLQASDHERQLIAYEIHDGLAQQLAGSIMQFQVYDHVKGEKPADAAKAFEAGLTMLQQCHFEARRLISGVRPPILDEEGIVAAVAHLVNEERRRGGPKIEYLSDVEFERLVPTLENAVYRIVQEALANACRYSQSKKIRVELHQRGDRLRIVVRDHGIGFDLNSVPADSYGLDAIRERARLLGGAASIESEIGKGTRIGVELPVIARSVEEGLGA